MKKYIVVERNRKFDSFDLINEDTDGLDTIWESHIPYHLNEDEKPRVRPLIFDNRSDAVRYKNKAQSDWDREWWENDYIYKRFGDLKPKWKVEEYTGNLFR